MNHYLIIFTSQLHKIKDNFQPFAVPSTCSLRECFVYTKENIFWKPRKAIKLPRQQGKAFRAKASHGKKVYSALLGLFVVGTFYCRVIKILIRCLWN